MLTKTLQIDHEYILTEFICQTLAHAGYDNLLFFTAADAEFLEACGTSWCQYKAALMRKTQMQILVGTIERYS